MWLSVGCFLLTLLAASAAQPYTLPHEVMQQVLRFKIFSEGRVNISSPLFSDIKDLRRLLNNPLNQGFQRLDYLTETCANQTRHLIESVSKGEMWALSMLDAWGKPEAGVFTGILNWLGDYDECIGVESTSEHHSQPTTLKYQGQYCTAAYNTEVFTNEQEVAIAIQVGMCVPSGCAADDVRSIFDSIVQIFSPKSSLSNITAICQPLANQKTWSGAAKATYSLYGVIFLLCLTAGLYDYYIHGTITYYKIHSLPIPVKLLAKTSSTTVHTLLDDDEGHLMQLDYDQEPIMYKPLSFLEASGLLLRRLWLTFSCYSNGYKILTPSQPPDAINCLHGIRFLSLSWVILGHSLLFSVQSIADPVVMIEWIKRFTFQVILNSSVAVDSFFMISGLLTSYLMLKDFTKRSIGLKDFFKTVPVLYLHRYLRLTPALGFLILFWTHGLYNFASGPMWPTTEITYSGCTNNTWAIMFYLSNLYDPSHTCAPWLWYLANDFQFFLSAPFFVGLLYWSGRIGAIFNVLTVAISCTTAVVATYRYNLAITLPGTNGAADAQKQMDGHWDRDYYVAPWVRYQSFGVGILFGYIIWKTNAKQNMHWLVNLILWLMSAALCLLPLYGVFDAETSGHPTTADKRGFFNGFSRTSWSLGLGYVVLACHSGRGGWVNELLSWPGFIPLSRMTYCAYLIHPVVMTIITRSQRSLFKLTDTVYVYTYLSYLFMSYGIAFIFSMMFEAPLLNIDKHWITGRMKKKRD